MKKKIYATMMAIGMVCSVLLSGCDSNDNAVGRGYLPDYTKAEAISKDFKIEYATVSADNDPNGDSNTWYNSVYVSSNYGYLGSIPNQEYGKVTCEYLTQVRCPEGFKFELTPLENKIDSAFITIYYDGYSGDPLAPLEVSAYQLNKPLEFKKHSINDVSEYTDMNTLLGKTTFYAKNGSGSTNNKNSGAKAIKIPLSDLSMGQRIYDLTRNDSEHFANQSNFDKFFPGMYITTTAGVGCTLRVFATALTFYFQVEEEVKDKESPNGVKKVKVTKSQELVHTSEVPQLSRFANEDLDKLIKKAEADDDYSYIKSPAGVLTEITIPTEEIRNFLQSAPEGYERILNSVQFSTLGENQPSHENDGERNTYALPAPQDLLLIPTDSVSTFFENELTDPQRPFTSFISQKPTSSSLSYDFGNITSVVLKHIENNENTGKNLKMRMIPIDRTVAQSQAGGLGTTSISNLVLPSAMKIRTNEKNRTIKVFVIQRKVGAPF